MDKQETVFRFLAGGSQIMESNQPPNECVRKSLSLKVKLPEREADHSAPSSDAVVLAFRRPPRNR